MTRFHRNAVTLGTAAALALAASSALAGPTGSFGTQVKQAVPNSATDVRFRRGAVAAGVAIGAIGAAAAIGAANSYNYGYGYDYYGPSYGYYGGENGDAYDPYAGDYYAYGGYGYPAPCYNSSIPERSVC